MRVLRVYHAGRDQAHRERERALYAAGVELTLLVPSAWPDHGSQDFLSPEPFTVVEAEVVRAGDVNRHRFADPAGLRALVDRLRPDVVDVHEEPVSSVLHQVLGLLNAQQCVVAYTAQNLDKRFPPPFAQRERAALGRLRGLYPCTTQAASVAVGKGFRGVTRVLPLAPSPAITAGAQQLPAEELRLLLVGRFVAEKGLLDAVAALAALQPGGRTTLTLVGAGPEREAVLSEAARLGVADTLVVLPWLSVEELAEQYRRAHVLLAPSRTTGTWVEQFGRMVVEAHAAGAVVVGYASGALPEVVGHTGVLVAEGDAAGLADAVADLRDHPARWSALRERGFRAAGTTTWVAVADGQGQLYEAALAGAAARGRVRPARTAARARYGPPASAGGPARPFALPLLRDGVPGTATLARVLDATAPRERAERPEDAPLRVVFLDHVAALSGGELAMLRLIAAMPEVRARVILGEDGPLRAQLEAAGVPVEVLALDPRVRDTRKDAMSGLAAVRSAAALVRYTARLAWRLHRVAPDVVHTNSLKSGFYGSVAARLARIPVVWHLRDRVAPDYLPPRAVAVTRWALSHLPNVVVANSRATLATAGLDPAGGSGAPATRVVYDPYTARPVQDQGRPRAVTTVGIVGRLAPWKGQDVVLRALAAPELAGVQLRVIGSAMFGEDAYATGLRTLAGELGVSDRVTFVGFTTDVEKELSLLDVLVHASVLPEPFGQVVVEGMAAGLPVVASRAGGPTEVITDGVDGVLVEPGDAAVLATVLHALLLDPAARVRLGRAAQLRAEAFRPALVGESMVQVYRELSAARRS